jgi:hypothetical protein
MVSAFTLHNKKSVAATERQNAVSMGLTVDNRGELVSSRVESRGLQT